MPKRILHGKAEQKRAARKEWIVYSALRQHCFHGEIAGGYFPSNHVCGCRACYPDLEVPIPMFDDRPTFTPHPAKKK